MKNNNLILKLSALAAGGLLTISSCKTPVLAPMPGKITLPQQYPGNPTFGLGGGKILPWRSYFKDAYLSSLIDSALNKNQELNILQQEIEIAKNEVKARKGEYLPFVGLGGSIATDKVGRYTRNGASEANIDIKPGKKTPDPLSDFRGGAFATWEVDIWHKLRNARKAALQRYLGTIEGKNFMVTQLIAEIAETYYELLALDNQLIIVRQNIEIQKDALSTIRMEKEATRVTELAVKRFEAQVLNTQNRQYAIEQRITVAENKIKFLTGSFPGKIERNPESFFTNEPDSESLGVPSQLLENRPDIRKAELALKAAELDVLSARANFYPSLRLTANLGINAFRPDYLLQLPEALLFSLAGDIAGPLVNRNAIKAMYMNANAKQIQALYEYQRALINAYREVSNQISNINNLGKSLDAKQKEVQTLIQAVNISGNLFRSARADYTEILLTQRDAIESRFELAETRMLRFQAWVALYRAVGGGWQ